MKCKRKSIETILSTVAQNGTNLTYLHVFKKILDNCLPNLIMLYVCAIDETWDTTATTIEESQQINLTRSVRYFNCSFVDGHWPPPSTRTVQNQNYDFLVLVVQPTCQVTEWLVEFDHQERARWGLHMIDGEQEEMASQLW